MVPRDLFDKMSALALVAIVLVAILSLEAFAAEIPYQDSGVALEESEGPAPRSRPACWPKWLASGGIWISSFML